jgi:uncharacterized protein (TIGR02118 family)
MANMAVSYLIRYEGTPGDPERFHAHYATTHARILRDMPGIRSLILHRPTAWNDPFPVQPGDLHLLAQMVFDSSADLDRALASEARVRAREDFANFPPFTGTVRHQALLQELIF